MIRFACVALLACGCATTARKIVHDENTDRIDVEMKREVFTEATPGAQGIVLGPEAPPLAVVSYADVQDYSYGRHMSGYGGGYGYGPWYTGGRAGTRVSYPGMQGNNGQTFGGGTAGGGPHPGSGGNFTGGSAGGSPHGGFGGSAGSHGGGRGGHR